MENISSCSLAGKAVDRYAVDQGNFKDHFLKILKIDRFRILGMTNLSGWTAVKKMMGLVFLLQAAEVFCWQERRIQAWKRYF